MADSSSKRASDVGTQRSDPDALDSGLDGVGTAGADVTTTDVTGEPGPQTGPGGMAAKGNASMGQRGRGADIGGTDVMGSGTAGANPSARNRVDTTWAGTGSGDTDIPNAGAGPGSTPTGTRGTSGAVRDTNDRPDDRPGAGSEVADRDTTASRVTGASLAGSGTAGSGAVVSGTAGSDIFGTNAARTDVTEADVTGAGIAGQGVSGSASRGTPAMGSDLQAPDRPHVPGMGKAAEETTDMEEKARGAVPGVSPQESRKTPG